ncbi:hypothetical protein [Coprobacter tertius]|uniref:Uncharacterized protein n=1 Tax=Coprobacter tertius TaxID=2944915 RepID=A0ABT1ME17_9BACT|nr:hypothetical protein [Coprobacter tertius]MCP9610878.1 hypothetical protein [Coprobacter tertius]
MKVNMLLAAIVLGMSIYCFGDNKVSSDIQPRQSKIESKDTVVNVSEHFAILYRKYDNDFKLWYNPYIIRLKENDTVKIAGFSYENGGELDLRISPSKRFVVLDNIIKGYVEDGVEKILHENYLCDIIDLEQSTVVVGSMQTHCGGEWDEDDRWVDGGKIIFDGSLLKKK